jgi:hypothetical protein
VTNLKTVPTTLSNSQNAETDRKRIDQLFLKFAAYYGHTWRSQFKQDDFLVFMKQEWEKSLVSIGDKELDLAIEECRTSKELPPTLPQFIELCQSIRRRNTFRQVESSKGQREANHQEEKVKRHNANLLALTAKIEQLKTSLSAFNPHLLGKNDATLGYSELLAFLSLVINGGQEIHFKRPLACAPIAQSLTKSLASDLLYPNGHLGQYLSQQQLFFGEAIQFQGASIEDTRFAAIYFFIFHHTFGFFSFRDLCSNFLSKHGKNKFQISHMIT